MFRTVYLRQKSIKIIIFSYAQRGINDKKTVLKKETCEWNFTRKIT